MDGGVGIRGVMTPAGRAVRITELEIALEDLETKEEALITQSSEGLVC